MVSVPTEGDVATAATNPLDGASFRAGDLVGGKYRLESRLGAGAMGEVWQARHEDLNTLVAIKFAHTDARGDSDRVLERFRFEAQVSAQLAAGSRHIVAVHDVGSHQQFSYAVMEHVSGGSLESLFVKGPLPAEDVAIIVEQMCEALACAHARGIWHRDIKPANILLARDDSGQVVAKLADFGVAKQLDAKLDVAAPKTTVQGMLVGTPSYMSPEQIAGEPATGASDLWSLAVVAYESLSGMLPFDGRSLSDLLIAISTRSHSLLAKRFGLAPEIDAFFARALAKDPLSRFDGPRELAEAFRRAATAPLKPPAPSRAWPLAVAMVVALGLIIAAANKLFGHADADPNARTAVVPSALRAAPSSASTVATTTAAGLATAEPAVSDTPAPHDVASHSGAVSPPVKSAAPRPMSSSATAHPSASAKKPRYDKSDTY